MYVGKGMTIRCCNFLCLTKNTKNQNIWIWSAESFQDNVKTYDLSPSIVQRVGKESNAAIMRVHYLRTET